jgi:hypothetical protein
MNSDGEVCVKYAEGLRIARPVRKPVLAFEYFRQRCVCGQTNAWEEGVKKYQQLISRTRNKHKIASYFMTPNIGPRRDCNYTTVRIAAKQLLPACPQHTPNVGKISSEVRTG